MSVRLYFVFGLTTIQTNNISTLFSKSASLFYLASVNLIGSWYELDHLGHGAKEAEMDRNIIRRYIKK